MSNKDLILQEILNWSKDKPIWQRDALRRIIENDEIKDKDLEELRHICKAIHDSELDQSLVENAGPLTVDHIPIQIPGVSKVTLNSISNTENINALAKEQTLKLFGNDKGIVIIYGDNASGKSGYGRIIKRTCRSRNRGKPIKSNVFQIDKKGKAKALISIKIDGKDAIINWIDGEPDQGELSYISFFDSECALSHVNDSNDIAFTPFGLDLLGKLAQIALKIHASLDAEKNNLVKQKPAVLNNLSMIKGTAVENIFKNLTSKSSFSEIKNSIVLTEIEKKRLELLKSDLSQDPNKLIGSLRLRLSNIKRMSERYQSVVSIISDNKCDEYKNVFQDALTKNKAAKIVAETLFSEEPLPKVGSDIWRTLWEAARAYSEVEAYEHLVFPYTEENAKCVLCQQPIRPEATLRFQKFEKYVKDNIQKTAKDSNKILQSTIQNIKNISIYSAEFKNLMEEIRLDNKPFFVDLRKFVLSAELRRRKILNALKNDTWTQITNIYELPLSDLEAYIGNSNVRIEELSKIINSDERKLMEQEKKEFEDRIWAQGVLDDIQQEIDRLAKIEKIDKAINDTLTKSITVKSRQLAEKFVTNKLRDRFVDELNRLTITNVRVELVKVGGEYGTAIYQIRLIAAPEENLKDILSEGEFRCIALAGFLTELATDNSGSGVVFDDPVSSLDHKWRKKVAERLVQEAAQRQVIVFTHDIVFLHDLLDYADSQKIENFIQRVYQSSNGYGTVGNELPWKAQNTLQRLDVLSKALGEAKYKFDSHEEETYEKLCTDIYSELRATVERAIEEHLFSRVLVRYRDYVNMKGLENVKIIQPSDVDTLLEIYEKCCNVTRAHDPSSGRNASAPNPKEAKNDIDKLEVWVRGIKQRKK